MLHEEGAVVSLSEAKRELLRRRLGTRAHDSGQIARRQEGIEPPLSPAQEPLWFMERFLPGTSTYTLAVAVRLRGALDTTRLSSALDVLVWRHESLRHRFDETEDGLPVVRVEAPEQVPLRVTGAATDDEVDDLIGQECAIPFDLGSGPLLRALLVGLDDGHHVLALFVHHLVADGQSVQLLFRDLFALYREEDPAPLPVRYGDFALWQRERRDSGSLEPDLAYWRRHLAGVPRLDLPTDRPRPADQSFDGASHRHTLAPDLVAALTELGREQGATPFMTMLAAFQLLLSRYSGQSDFAVSTPVDGRVRPELSEVVGMFVNTLALRARIEDGQSFRELVTRVRDTTVDALDHQELPFASLVEALNVPRDPSRQPLADILFSAFDLSASGSTDTLPVVTDYPLALGSSRHDLELYAVPAGDSGLACTFVYKTALFDAATIARMAGHLENLLRAAVIAPDAPAGELTLLGEAERRLLTETWNDTAADFPSGATLHDLVEAQARRTPDAVAVTFQGSSLTYRELGGRANQVAHGLRRQGVAQGALVAVCAERSLELVAGLLGVLKAGAAYVPLDPDYPADRLAFMLADAQAPAVLTQLHLADRLTAGGAVILPLDLPAVWDGLPETAVDAAGEPGTAAYMIYTSGSTGRPKGVPNSHRGIVNRLDWMQKRYSLRADDVVLQKTPTGFDVSVWEFFWPLTTGARLVLAEPGGHRDPAYLRDLINAERVTTLHFVPSMLAVFLAEEGVGTCASLRRVVCSGEELPVDVALRCLDLLPAELHNLYGPTEAAIDVSAWHCTTEALAGRSSVPIGSPIQNITLHVLDRYQNPTPIGVPGELHIGGVGLALGYHGRPELTAERFIPFGEGRLYRTGDLARWRPDGTIEFLGRLDDQVKLHGLRIEPGEIETTLRERAGVREAVVVVREDVPGDKRLVAYVVGDDVPEAARLRAALRGTLPEYMLPSMFVTLDELPLTPNGKLDRGALPSPAQGGAADAEYAEPRTEVERAIALVWQQALSVDRVGIDDDFFDLGGHSLLAIQVVAKLRRALPDGSRQVSLVDLFTCRTVRELAQLAADGPADGARPLLQRLTPVRAAALTYVCVPYGSGSAIVYQPLAEALPDDHALYAVAIPGHDIGLDEDAMDFEELAASCAEEILRTVEGPLVVYGHCGVGAALAIDLTRRLEAAGRQVEAVYIGAIFPFARPRGMLRSLSRLLELDRFRSNQVYLDRLKSRGVDLGELEPGVADRIIRTMRHDSIAAERYFTGLFDSPDLTRLRAPIVSVIGERDPATDFYEERFKEWRFLTGTAALVVLDEGGHYFLRYRAEELADVLTSVHRALKDPPAREPGDTWWVHGVAEDSGTPAPTVQPGMGRFLTIASGQQLSMIGSALTGWALPLSILMDSGSLLQFTLLSVLNLAGLLLAPVAGAIVDRGDRRRVLLLADCASAAIQAVLAGLILLGDLQLWHIYLLIVALSISSTFQRLAYTSAIPQLVPKRYLGHAIGVAQFTGGIAQLVVPLVAAGLLSWIGLGGIVLIDAVSYGFAIAVVLLVRFPDTLPWRPREPLGTEIAKGFAYTWGKRGLRAMLIYFAALNVFLSPLLLLVSPLVLSFGTLGDAGRISVVAGAGATLGGLTMSLWGGPSRERFRAVLAATLVMAFAGAVTGLRPSLLLIGVGVFALTFSLTVMNAIYSTIVQLKVPPRYHGRVFALNTLVAWSTLPLGLGVVAPLGAALFDPLLAPDGALASTVGAVIGVGPGRGIAFMYLVCAVGVVLVVAGARRVRPLVVFDQETPDSIPDDLVGVEELERRRLTPVG